MDIRIILFLIVFIFAFKNDMKIENFISYSDPDFYDIEKPMEIDYSIKKDNYNLDNIDDFKDQLNEYENIFDDKYSIADEVLKDSETLICRDTNCLCSPNPCEFNSICSPIYEHNTYYCSSPQGFPGQPFPPSSHSYIPEYYIVPVIPITPIDPPRIYGNCIRPSPIKSASQITMDRVCRGDNTNGNPKLCGTLNGGGDWLNCYINRDGVCAAISQEKCVSPDKTWCGGSPPPQPQSMNDNNKRVFKFTNKTSESIVILGQIGDKGYLSGNIPHWSWLKNTSEPNIVVGDPGGIDGVDGWSTFVITEIPSDHSINIIFPLINANLSDNLRGHYLKGISGMLFVAAKNENFNVDNIGRKIQNKGRFEITLQNNNQGMSSPIILDSYNLSGIPDGTCSGHINSKAINYRTEKNINSGPQCKVGDTPMLPRQPLYSYDVTKQDYYEIAETNLDSPTFYDNGIPTEPNYICGFPQHFSSPVLNKCGLSGHSDIPGENWKNTDWINDNKALSENIIKCGVNTAYKCGLDTFKLANNPASHEPIGINYDIQVTSGYGSDKTLIKSMLAPGSGGYDNQKEWDIYSAIQNNTWNAYGYPYQEELDSDVLDSDKQLSIVSSSPSEIYYYIDDIVKYNNIANNEIVSSPINGKTISEINDLNESYFYEIVYHDLGSCINHSHTANEEISQFINQVANQITNQVTDPVTNPITNQLTDPVTNQFIESIEEDYGVLQRSILNPSNW